MEHPGRWRSWHPAFGWAFCVLILAVPRVCHSAAGSLSLEMHEGAPRFRSSEVPGHILFLKWSTDLVEWVEAARVHEQLHPYRDPFVAAAPHGFFCLSSAPQQATDDWTNQLHPALPRFFASGGAGAASLRLCKWSLLLQHPDRVYFQDTARHPFHLQFARARLPGYESIGAMQYYAEALYATDSQRMAIGSVMTPALLGSREVAIELTGAEAFPAVRAVHWIRAVQSRLVVDASWRVFYLPSQEQREETQGNLALFAAHGIEVGTFSHSSANASPSP